MRQRFKLGLWKHGKKKLTAPVICPICGSSHGYVTYKLMLAEPLFKSHCDSGLASKQKHIPEKFQHWFMQSWTN